MDELLATIKANIKVLLVIDTDHIMAHHEPNNDGPDSPQRVDGRSLRVIYTGARGIQSENEDVHLTLKAKKEDHITFRALSSTGNADDAVILYHIKHKEGTRVFSSFITDIDQIDEAAVPDPDTGNDQQPLHVRHEQLDFTSQDSKIRRLGTEVLTVRFGVYNLDDRGVMQDLYGYFECDAKITVEK